MRSARLFKLALAQIAMISLASCASNPHKVEKVDTEIQTKGDVQGATVGINKDNEAIIQKETSADEELRSQKWKNSEVAQLITSEHRLLNRCQTDLADPRLGGDGTVAEIPEIEDIESKVKSDEQFGLSPQGNLVIVKKEKYLDRLQAERARETSLRTVSKIVTKHKETCLRKMSAARVKAGLPAQWISAKGHYASDGRWIMTSPAENTLDDAFSLSARAPAKSE